FGRFGRDADHLRHRNFEYAERVCLADRQVNRQSRRRDEPAVVIGTGDGVGAVEKAEYGHAFPPANRRESSETSPAGPCRPPAKPAPSPSYRSGSRSSSANFEGLRKTGSVG